MKLNLPYPSNWSDFQDLCYQLWKEMWRDSDAHLNGRNGQAQNGVDIWGKNMFAKGYSGVQCKGKNGNYQSALTTDEIDIECGKAIKFTPKLTSFIMATTSPRDVNVQQHCRNLTLQHKYPFSVDTWSWGDIEDEVQCRPTIMDRFYPAIKDATLLSEIQIPVFAPVNKLHAFFTRPGLFHNLNMLSLNILKDLACEIALNAFEHGAAGTFRIKVENNKVIFADNGKPFDYSKLKDSNGNGGKETMEYATKIFDITYRYDTENILEISLLKESMPLIIEQTTHTINLNANDIFGRGQAEQFICKELQQISISCQKIVIDICGQPNPTISGSFAAIDKLLQFNKTRTVVIYLPENLYYNNTIINKYGDIPNVDIIIKR